MAKEVFAAAGIPQARFRAFREHETRRPACRPSSPTSSGYPLFVKPANMGSSVGVSKAHDGRGAARRDRRRARATTSGSWSRRRSSAARSRSRCSATSSPGRRCPARSCPAHEFYDYEDKYVDGRRRAAHPGRRSPTRRPPRSARWRCEAFRALRCEGMARVDFFYEEPTAAASSSTRSTRFPASRRSRCTRSCGSTPACRTPN